jgi:hypothetical protein
VIPANAILAVYTRPTCVRRVGLLLALLLANPALSLAAQPEYRNIDGGRPLRIEDAEASARHSLDFQIAPARLDRISGSFYRWQVEPRVSYTAFPRTELKVRAPIAYRERGADPRGGLVALGLGAFHNLVTESSAVPALAMEGEVALSAGGSQTSGRTYSVRGIATRTFGRSRLHTNVGYGTYRVLVYSPNAPAGAPQIPDGACSVSPPAASNADGSRHPAAGVRRSLPGGGDHLRQSARHARRGLGYPRVSRIYSTDEAAGAPRGGGAVPGRLVVSHDASRVARDVARDGRRAHGWCVRSAIACGVGQTVIG